MIKMLIFENEGQVSVVLNQVLRVLPFSVFNIPFSTFHFQLSI